jgi:hypothetical protein
MQKIDFFGGFHGNFLELVVNVAINQNGYDITKPQFTKDGACHLKNEDTSYTRTAVATHYSFFKRPFRDSDTVIQIVPTANDLLIGLTNSFLTAGDQRFEIDNLDKDTLNKLSKLGKGINLQNTIINDYGYRIDYPRTAIRNYFYSMLSDYDNGLQMVASFIPAKNSHQFPFRAFFNVGYFYQELNAIAKFLVLNFYPTVELGELHKQFLERNEGYHSEMKCQQVWQDILLGKSRDIKLNLIEEAWINHQVASTFRCYDHPLLVGDQYPTNTLEISQAIFEWKAQDH